MFEDPAEVIQACRPEEVVDALNRIEKCVERGCHCAGFLAYEAATGIDPTLATLSPSAGMPLVWFGVFSQRREIRAGLWGQDDSFSIGPWDSSISRSEYDEAIARIREWIAAGDTYQVNYTFRRRAPFSGNTGGFYRALCRAQGAAYSAFLDTGRHQILSASPELFFQIRGRQIVTRPMKGTAARGRWIEEDEAAARTLTQSAKERAENLMIVDLMRNDLGRVAVTGSVDVPSLFDVERYETVWQMTSTVRARLRESIGLVDLFRALFPSGSVTGAPKIHTMELIREMESTPRGIYTGAIGYVSPNDEAAFSVAIRTVVVDRETGVAECGVGGGITFDSASAAEFEECEIKTRFLVTTRPEFEILESLLYESAEGYFLLDRHLARLAGSAQYFGFSAEPDRLRGDLLRASRQWPEGRYKVRLLVSRSGESRIEHAPIKSGDPATTPPSPLKVCIAREPVDSRDPFLFHKTTHRAVYDRRIAAHPECDDVILINDRGEVTESTRANLVVDIHGTRYTPPIKSGLLPGIFREELLARGAIKERILRPDDVTNAQTVYLINSVRKWMRVCLR